MTFVENLIRLELLKVYSLQKNVPVFSRIDDELIVTKLNETQLG